MTLYKENHELVYSHCTFNVKHSGENGGLEEYQSALHTSDHGESNLSFDYIIFAADYYYCSTKRFVYMYV